jgi:hypothetical protein
MSVSLIEGVVEMFGVALRLYSLTLASNTNLTKPDEVKEAVMA